MGQKIRLVLSLTLLLLFGCLKKSDNFNVKTLYVPVVSKVKGFDPIYSNDLYSAVEIARVYEGLLHFHYLKRPYVVEPVLATEMPNISSDGLTYTFKIQPGVYFHDDVCFAGGKGRELEAKDFVYVFKRNANPIGLPSEGWWTIDKRIVGLNEWRDKAQASGKPNYEEEVAGVKALDKYTLQVSLKSLYPQFLYIMTMPYFFATAKECVDHYGEDYINHPVGTGPYLLKEFKQTNHIVYKRNPKYRDRFYPTEGNPGDKELGLLNDAGKKIPFADEVVADIIEESQPRWLKFISGGTDLINVPKDNFSNSINPDHTLKKEMSDKGIKLTLYSNTEVTFIGFNHDNPLFKNKKLRQAMSMALNNNESIRLFYNDLGIHAQSVVPPGIAGYDPNYVNPYRQYDLKKAKELLKEAGYENGVGLPEITLDMPSSTDLRQQAEWMKAQFKVLGINIKVLLEPWPEFQNRLDKRQEMLFAMAWNADYPDAENFFAILYGPNATPGTNHSNYNDPKFNKMYEECVFMPDSPERTEKYRQLNQYVAEEVPLIFDLHRAWPKLTQKWITNYVGGEISIDQAIYWNVDMQVKEKTLKEKF